MAKPAIRWKAVAQDSALAGRMIYVPMVVDRTAPVDLTTLIERAIDTGRIAGLKPSAAQGIAEAVAEMIAATLREGEGVKFGDYFTVRMYLDGTVDGPLATLGAANNINAKIITGSKLKISRDMFSFRNVNATGDDPFIDEVQSDIDGAVNAVVELGRGLAARLVAAMSASGMFPGVIEPSMDVMLVGESVKLVGDDIVKAAWYPAPDAAAPTSTAEISVASLVGTDDAFVRFHWSALSPMGGLASGYVRFSVVKDGRESNAIDARISEE